MGRSLFDTFCTAVSIAQTHDRHKGTADSSSEESDSGEIVWIEGNNAEGSKAH